MERAGLVSGHSPLPGQDSSFSQPPDIQLSESRRLLRSNRNERQKRLLDDVERCARQI
jgi:hypothetical protein